MAQKVSITLVDDMDGTVAEETVTFGLDGTTYEIDLNKLNAKKLRHAFADYCVVARKVTTKRKGPTGGTRKVREWARANGLEVSDRGMVSAEVRKAYDAAH